MDKAYCDEKIAELEAEKDSLKQRVPKIIEKLKCFANEDIFGKYFKEAIEEFENGEFERMLGAGSIRTFHGTMKMIVEENLNGKYDGVEWLTDEEAETISKLSWIDDSIAQYKFRLLDSDWKRFDGDVIITDPCYITPDNLSADKENDFRDDLEEALESKGFCRDTIYGDWSCKVFDTDTQNPVGEFCADGGMVCVALLKDVLEFNPDFNYHTERDWTTAWLKDFHGEIRTVVSEDHYEYGGKDYTEYSVHIEGRGSLNFRTDQTGL